LGAGLSPGTSSQVIRSCVPHPFGAALERVRHSPSSPGRGAKLKALGTCRGLFLCASKTSLSSAVTPHCVNYTATRKPAFIGRLSWYYLLVTPSSVCRDSSPAS